MKNAVGWVAILLAVFSLAPSFVPGAMLLLGSLIAYCVTTALFPGGDIFLIYLINYLTLISCCIFCVSADHWLLM